MTDLASVTLEQYSYLGLDTVVVRSQPQPGLSLSYVQQGSDPLANADGGDQYTGLDRFGRIIDQNWLETGTGTSVVRLQYGYDRDDNRSYQQDLVQTSNDELYQYDGLNQLIGFGRGTLNSSHTGLTA